MKTIDLLFLIALLTVLTVMLVFSKVIRAIAWESLRHPFMRSRIEVRGDKVEVQRMSSASLPMEKTTLPPTGAR